MGFCCVACELLYLVVGAPWHISASFHIYAVHFEGITEHCKVQGICIICAIVKLISISLWLVVCSCTCCIGQPIIGFCSIYDCPTWCWICSSYQVGHQVHKMYAWKKFDRHWNFCKYSYVVDDTLRQLPELFAKFQTMSCHDHIWATIIEYVVISRWCIKLYHILLDGLMWQ